MVQQAISDTLPPADAALPQKCDQEGCEEPATLAYRWDWGQTGVCCALHATLLQQTGQNLSRAIVVHPIALPAPAPLLRDERIALTARSLVLEAELAEAKQAGLRYHEKNGDLQLQLNTAVVRDRELKAQLSDAAERLRGAEARCKQLEEQNGELVVERDRLRDLETLVAEREAHERGLEGPNVVEG